MTEWMIKLEQAKKLLDAGALTQHEFDREKAHLLPQPPSVTDYDDGLAATRSQNWRWAAVGVLLFGVAGTAVWFLTSGRGEPDHNITSDPISTPITAPVKPPVAAKPVKTVELSETLQFSSPSECIAGGALERIFSKFDKAMEKGSHGMVVKLDAYDDGLPVSAQSNTDQEGIYRSNADIKFPEGSNWHGLRISRVTAELIAPPESDSSYSRTLNFFEPPEKVLRTLNALGFNAQLAPNYSDLHDDACGGSMQVASLPGGSTLSCNWGC